MVKRMRSAALLAAFALSACGGGNAGLPNNPAGSSNALAPATSASARSYHGKLRASARIFIPREKHRHRGGLHPHWVSGATDGILIVTYLSSDSTHTHPIGTVATDLSASSGNCTPSTGGGRICNVLAVALVGSDDFVVTTYDQVPVHNAFPPSANVLGEASLLDQTIKATTNPAIPIYIGGLIATIGSSQPYVSASVGSPQTIALSISAEDFGNQPIGGGAKSPYANPMTATLTELGGSGNATLLLNGTAVSGNTATLASSADSVSIAFNGNGSAGYTMKVAVTATGATSQTVQVSPLYLSSTQFFTAATNTLGFTAPDQTSTVNITERNATGITYSFTALPAGKCTPTAGFGAISGSSASSSLLATSVGAGNGCLLTVTDSLGSTNTILVQTTTTLGSVHIPASVASTGVSGPTYGAVFGPDSNLYFTSPTGKNVIQVNPGCTPSACVNNSFAVTTGTPEGITMGPDGNMWFAEQGAADLIARLTPAGALTEFPIVTGSGATALVTGPDGAMWFTANLPGQVGRITNSGALTMYVTDDGPTGITRGSDGRIWVAATLGPDIDAIDMAGNVTSYAVSVEPFGITSGSDGNLWFTSENGNVIGCMTTAGAACTIAACPPTGNAAICSGLLPGANPAYITTGADGALWFTETGAGSGGNSMIGKITTAGTLTSYVLTPNLTTTSRPTTPIVGGDGSIWFSTAGANNSVGQIVP